MTTTETKTRVMCEVYTDNDVDYTDILCLTMGDIYNVHTTEVRGYLPALNIDNPHDILSDVITETRSNKLAFLAEIRSSEYYEWDKYDYISELDYALDFFDDLAHAEQLELLHSLDFPEIVIVPIYAYCHSMATISAGGFSCGWDSGQWGATWVSVEHFIKYTGCTNATKEDIHSQIVNAISEYDDMLQGRVYGYTVWEEKFCPNCEKWEEVETLDSCVGFIGADSIHGSELGSYNPENYDEQMEKVW